MYVCYPNFRRNVYIEESIKMNNVELLSKAYDIGQRDGMMDGANVSVNPSYANHVDELVRNVYNQGLQNGKMIYNELNEIGNDEVQNVLPRTR